MYNYGVNIFWTKEDMHYRLIAWKGDKNLDYPFTSEFWKEIKKKKHWEMEIDIHTQIDICNSNVYTG